MVSAKRFKVSLHQMRVKFFSHLTRFMLKVRSLLSLLFSILLMLGLIVSHICYMDRKLLDVIIVNCLILYMHSIVSCVGSIMLTSSYCPCIPLHWADRHSYGNNIVRRRNQFLSKCLLNRNSVIRYIAHTGRFDS